VLEVTALRARYGELEALHGIDFRVERGSIVALLGANGAGKTTTLRAIAGTCKRAGSISLDGTLLVNCAPEDLARLGVALVPEGRGTLAELSVHENLALGGYILSTARARERYRRVVAYFPWLEERKRQAAGTLSGGQQQMLAIARALMMEPRVILLDEPSLGLAPLVVRQIFTLLQTINAEEGVTMLIAEQNAAIALETARYAYVLETGEIAAEGTAEELRRDDQIRRSYLGFAVS